MSEKKTVSFLDFIKRNLYYLLIGISLIIIATVIAIILITNDKSPSEGKVNNSTPPAESIPVESTPQESEPNEPIQKPDDKPVDTKIIFTMPVTNGQIIKSYTSSTVVYNQTLGVYTGHMGIDFGSSAGEKVYAAFGGTVESVTSSYLQGTTITIDHGNGLKSIYNSIEANENLYEGKSVVAGEQIGEVSDNNRQEYKDGPHLHFEVTLNGKRVDPNDYLMISEK